MYIISYPITLKKKLKNLKFIFSYICRTCKINLIQLISSKLLVLFQLKYTFILWMQQNAGIEISWGRWGLGAVASFLQLSTLPKTNLFLTFYYFFSSLVIYYFFFFFFSLAFSYPHTSSCFCLLHLYPTYFWISSHLHLHLHLHFYEFITVSLLCVFYQ